MAPLLAEKVQQHCQGLPAQSEISFGVLAIKITVQDRNRQIDPAVHGSGLFSERNRSKTVEQ